MPPSCKTGIASVGHVVVGHILPSTAPITLTENGRVGMQTKRAACSLLISVFTSQVFPNFSLSHALLQLASQLRDVVM